MLVCNEKNTVAFNDSVCFSSMGSYRTLNLPACGSSCSCVRFVRYLSDCSPRGTSLSPPFFTWSIIILRVCTVSRACQHTWRSLMMCVREASGIFQQWAMEIAQSMLLLEISSMEVSGAENHASYSVVLSVRRLRRSKHLSAIRAWCSGSKRICGLTRTRFALEKNSGSMSMSRT
jgi:hypothetical protein